MKPKQFKSIDKLGNYIYLGIPPEDVLDANMTIDQLVTLVSRETSHTARRVEGRLLTLINSMLANYAPKDDE